MLPERRIWSTVPKLFVRFALLWSTSSSLLVHNQRQPLVGAIENYPVLLYPDQPEFYSHTKALAEKIVLSAIREAGMFTTSLKSASMYGSRDGMMTTNIIN
jgi:sterol-4alpha-carboxylate 3-dehydrogenase (decarboxylating)